MFCRSAIILCAATFVCGPASAEASDGSGSQPARAHVLLEAAGSSATAWRFESNNAFAEVVGTTRHEVHSRLSLQLEPSPTEAATLGVTEGHPVWTEPHAAWRDAAGLVAGDRLATAAGGLRRVSGHTSVRGPVSVYNLDVASPHNYYVAPASCRECDFILVHNKETTPVGHSSSGANVYRASPEAAGQFEHGSHLSAIYDAQSGRVWMAPSAGARRVDGLAETTVTRRGGHIDVVRGVNQRSDAPITPYAFTLRVVGAGGREVAINFRSTSVNGWYSVGKSRLPPESVRQQILRDLKSVGFRIVDSF